MEERESILLCNLCEAKPAGEARDPQLGSVCDECAWELLETEVRLANLGGCPECAGRGGKYLGDPCGVSGVEWVPCPQCLTRRRTEGKAER